MLQSALPVALPMPDTETSDRVHDLRNLFAVIASCAHLLQDRPMTDEQAMVLHAIDRAAMGGAQGAQELLARTEGTTQRRVDANSVVADLQPVLAAMLGPRARLTLDLCTDPLPLALDTRELDSALIELVLNARRALASYGGVTIRSRRIGARVWLFVADDGRGLARPHWPHLEAIDGRPNGLPRIERWLRRVHGRLHWRSSAGSGTVAVLDIPLRIALRDHGGDPRRHRAMGEDHARRPVAA